MSFDFISLLLGVLAGFGGGFWLSKRMGSVDTTPYKDQINELKNELQTSQSRLVDLEKSNSALETEKIALNEKIEFHQEQMVKVQESFQKEVNISQEKMKAEFENLANKIFEEKNNSFKTASKENMENILTPLKLQLDGFRKNMDEKYSNEEKERFSLRKEIENLALLNKTITEETHNLTSALKSEVKKQGDWGEIKLELLLERSGLEKGVEYITQGKGMGMKSEEGNASLPDVIVHLPEDKHIIIDSKVSLKSYLEFIDADSEEDRALALSNLVSSVRAHIDGLSGKNYHFNEKLFTPEFTFLFFPLEGALSLILDTEIPRTGKTLMQYAWEKSIVIVTPSTLMATLRTIASIWKFDKQEKNAINIAEQGGKLYDKFVGFVSDLESIKRNLDNTNKSYDDAMNKLSTGRGNILNQVEKMRVLGAKAKKSLPTDMVEMSGLGNESISAE